MNIVFWKFRNSNLLKNKILHSLFHAIVGLIHAFYKQKNLKRMLFITIIVTIVSIVFSFTFVELFLVMYAICVVFITELINTSLELIVDLITKEKRLRAMLAKDVAASATLIAVVQSIMIALYIFINRII